MYMKEPHRALFVGFTGCGETECVLQLLETEYKEHFDFIVIICPTLKYNRTCTSRRWIMTDRIVILIEPKNHLYEWIKKMDNFCVGCKTLFLNDDIIADNTLDEKRQPLLELAISGRHRNHSLWLLTQSYTAIPKNLRRQAKMMYVWYPKDRNDLNTIHQENDVIETKEDLTHVKKKLKEGEHICLVMRIEHPRTNKVCSSNPLTFCYRLL